jgi:hypothetical protein
MAVAGMTDGGDGSGAEDDRDAASFGQRGRIELEPARVAAPRQTAVAHYDIGGGAGGGERLHFDRIGAARREDVPGSAAGRARREAEIGTALRAGLILQRIGMPSIPAFSAIMSCVYSPVRSRNKANFP